MMSSSELLPCPFCGKPPHFTPRRGSFAAYVACTNESCGVQPESGSMDPAYAKARWNTRPLSMTGEMEAALGALFHEAMVHAVREFKGDPQPWQNGNSTAESYARQQARAAIAAIQEYQG